MSNRFKNNRQFTTKVNKLKGYFNVVNNQSFKVKPSKISVSFYRALNVVLVQEYLCEIFHLIKDLVNEVYSEKT